MSLTIGTSEHAQFHTASILSSKCLGVTSNKTASLSDNNMVTNFLPFFPLTYPGGFKGNGLDISHKITLEVSLNNFSHRTVYDKQY